MLALGIILLLTSCISSSGGPERAGYDKSPLNVYTFSMFNQIVESAPEIAGDWVLRRERLQALDEQIRVGIPNVLVMQEVMKRQGSVIDSDVAILSAGSLSEFEFFVSKTSSHSPTYEDQSLAVAVGLPAQFNRFVQQSGETLVQIGKSSFVQFGVADLGGNLSLIGNVQIDRKDNEVATYLNLASAVNRWLSRKELCPFRIIIGGYFPYPQKGMTVLKELTGLKDTSEGACIRKNDCLTSTSLNEFSRLADGERPPAREDFVLVHNETIVFDSRRSLIDEVDGLSIGEKGVKRSLKYWFSERAAWRSVVRLPICKS